MMVPKEYSYLFAIGTIFAFLDAWNIGKPSPFSPFTSFQPSSNENQVPTMSPTRGPAPWPLGP